MHLIFFAEPQPTALTRSVWVRAIEPNLALRQVAMVNDVRFPLLPRFLVGWIAFVAVGLGSNAQPALSEDRLSEVIESICQNEALYDELEVTWTSVYELGTMKHPSNGVLQHREKRGRYVRQNGMFFLDCGCDQRSVEGDPAKELQHWSKLIGFDGTTTRCLEDNGGFTGNIVSGLRDDVDKFLPHRVCLAKQYRGEMVPLSVWLRGQDAVASWPGAKIFRNRGRSVAWSRRERIDGLDCEVLEVSFGPASSDVVTGKFVVWLAEERNYLPIQSRHFTVAVSSDIPINECVMTDLRELEAGVWFPFRIQTTKFDRPSLQEDGKHVAAWTEEHLVDKVSLDPNYDKSFFSNIEFPDGIAVYEIENGEIVRSRIQGGGPPPEPVSEVRSRWTPLFVVSLALLAMAVAFVAAVARRRTRVSR